MKDKIELLMHIDAPTRKEVLRWCREYEAEITKLKKNTEKYEDRYKQHREYKVLYYVVSSVIAAIKRKGRCTVFYDGRFKVLTQDARIEKENSLLVGIYDEDFITAHLVEDLRCTLNDVKETDAPSPVTA